MLDTIIRNTGTTGLVSGSLKDSFCKTLGKDPEIFDETVDTGFQRQKSGICASKSLSVWLNRSISGENKENTKEYMELKLFVLDKYKDHMTNGFSSGIENTKKTDITHVLTPQLKAKVDERYKKISEKIAKLENVIM